ncbi:hypothetical protein OROMI_018251 [Orobanche minor]
MGIELEQSSSSRRGQGEEKRIIMLALDSESVDLDRLEDGAERNCFGRVDFHMVDLKDNKITHCCFPSLIMIVPSHHMSLNGFIYIVGGVTPLIVQSPEFDFQRLQCQSPISNRTFYFGGSSIDLSDEAAVWCPAHVFIANQFATSNYGPVLPSLFSVHSVQLKFAEENRPYVSFLGKIYSFGPQRLEPEVLDPATVGHSEPIYPLPVPEHVVGCSVSILVLPDPSKNRILVRLHGGQLSSPSLYAFTPPADTDGIGTWKYLIPDFPVWADSAAVVDGVIYFHCHKFPSLLRAFHIAEEKWLKVWWDSCFKDNVNLNVERMHFDALLPLGHNILCFAAWTPIYSEPSVSTLSVVFYKFEVLRDTGKTISVDACDSYSYELPQIDHVLHFISV